MVSHARRPDWPCWLAIITVGALVARFAVTWDPLVRAIALLSAPVQQALLALLLSLQVLLLYKARPVTRRSDVSTILGIYLIALSAALWRSPEPPVAWLLNQRLIVEEATSGLLSAAGYLALGGVAVGLVAARPMEQWALVPLYNSRPARFLIASLGRLWVALGVLAHLLWRWTSDLIYEIAMSLAAVLLYLWRGVAFVLRALWRRLAWAGHHLWLGIATVAHFGWRVLSAISAVLWRWISTVLRYSWLGLSAVALLVWSGLTTVAGYLWHGISTVAGYLWLGLSTVLRYSWLGLSTVLRLLGRGLTWSLGHVWRGVVAVARLLWAGVSAVADLVAVTASRLWAGTLYVARNVWLGISTAVRYFASGISAVLRLVWRGCVVAVGFLWLVVSSGLRFIWTEVSAGLRYIWNGVSTIARYLWRGLVKVLRYLWLGLSAVARYLWSGVSTVVRHAWSGCVAAARLLVLTTSTALRYLWRGIIAVLARVWLGISSVASLIWVGVSAAARRLWLGISTISRLLWLSLAALLHTLGRGIVAAVRVLSTVIVAVLRYLWRGVMAVLRYLWIGVSTVLPLALGVIRFLSSGIHFLALAIGRTVRYLWHGVVTVLGYVWLGVSTATRYLASWLSALVRLVWLGLSTAARYAWLGIVAVVLPLWLGVSAVLRLAVRGCRAALGYIWLGLSTFGRFVWLGGSAIARRIGWGVSTAFQYLVLGASTLLRYACVVVAAGIRPLWRGVSFGGSHLWLGIVTGALAVVWLARGLWHGTLVAGSLALAAPRFAGRTVKLAYLAAPDAGRMLVSMARERKGVPALSDFNLSRERLLSLIATVWVFGMLGFIISYVRQPPPPPPTVQVAHWTTGHLLQTGSGLRLLQQMSEDFNRAGHRTTSGTLIEVKIHYASGATMTRDLTSRLTQGVPIDPALPDPTMVTPSASHWLVNVNYAAGREVVDLSDVSNKSIARTYVGILTYRDMAECLGWPRKEIGFADIIALRNDPLGWARYPCAKAEWGKQPLVAFTDPSESDTGRAVLFALYGVGAGKPMETLTLADVHDPTTVDYVQRFARVVDHYMATTSIVNTKIYQGTRYGHFFIMPEDNVIRLYKGTEKAFVDGKEITAPKITQRMVMIYPKEGAQLRDNCACVVQAPWVTAEQVEAAQQWVAFLREDTQQRDFLAAGFRPGTDLAVGDPISAQYGLDPREPSKLLYSERVNPAVGAAIDKSWPEIKKPGIVTFVADTSGSMMVDDKLTNAKKGLISALDGMAQNNQVGLVAFDDVINARVPVAPLAENKYKLRDTINAMKAGDQTALYDAIKAAVEMTDAAEGPDDAIRGVVVLTDGKANRGSTHLHDVVKLMSSNEVEIVGFDGMEDSPTPVQVGGGTVEKKLVIGTAMALNTRHPIQIFFIGVGKDADMQIGRMLAQATGAEFQASTEKDLANVIATFGKYF